MNLFFQKEILSNGKSRAFINDSPVKLEILKNITQDLINIQSQNQDLVLNQKSFYYNLIDSDEEINLMSKNFYLPTISISPNKKLMKN